MTIIERIKLFDNLFDELQATNSRIDKEYYVNRFSEKWPELHDDLIYILETLAGKHPIGWTFKVDTSWDGVPEAYDTVKKWIMSLESCLPKTDDNTSHKQHLAGKTIGTFLESIVNRTLRLGIGQSLLEKSNLSPMLAKKFDNHSPILHYIVTEKLNGNRCIAYYSDSKWHFVSRSGKPLKVDIDMTRMPTEYIYDGELLSYDQTQQSIRRTIEIQMKANLTEMSDFASAREFSKTTGMVNDKETRHSLVYNVFDIIDNDMPAMARKKLLLEIGKQIDYAYPQVRILPILYQGKDLSIIDKLLDDITFTGGEGLMLNNPHMHYQNKRTDALLKYKKVKTMDMYVMSLYEGTGKYEGMVGSLWCYLMTDDGKQVHCSVGTGLSDTQRGFWYENPKAIIGKVVEVGYQSISQRKDSKDNEYSLQFPRLLRVRTDKTKPSEY